MDSLLLQSLRECVRHYWLLPEEACSCCESLYNNAYTVCPTDYGVPSKEDTKAIQHMVRSMGVNDHRFEITLRSKGGVGSDTRIVTYEMNVGQVFNGWCECSCNKSKLLHVLCSHLLAALSQVSVGTLVYVSQFYLKENVVLTWTGEFRGFNAYGDFK